MQTETGKIGLMAEWLGRGLQNLVQRFESASDLQKDALQYTVTHLFIFYTLLYDVLGWAIDAATGAITKPANNYYQIEMKK